MTSIKPIAQHWFNPLHVYCRLRDLGLGKGLSKRIASVWGRVWPWRQTEG